MPYVLIANRRAIDERIEHLARCLELPEPGFNSFLNWILAIRDELGIPNSLVSIKINDGDAELVGRMAVEDPSAGGNPLAFSAEEYSQLFVRAVRGELES